MLPKQATPNHGSSDDRYRADNERQRNRCEAEDREYAKRNDGCCMGDPGDPGDQGCLSQTCGAVP